MKTLKQITLLFCIALFSACHNDDHPNYYPGNPSIQGNWKLVNVSGSIAGTSDDFPQGMITWTFNNLNQTVSIVNNNTNEAKQDILPTGTYTYNFENNEATPTICAQTIKVDGINLGCYTISTNQFLMNQTESDGFQITLVR